ncbi:bifunctional diguanylate cyclase/phosphodiesterase [Candidatus Methylocalor cossyra]|uniref:Cyclic diguanylate phosphodiesterase domain protein n=1 Tax=Candidatus Methylocalor cossyra TaxID=3108543 RepID=A0ABM9NIL5_9GAMM
MSQHEARVKRLLGQLIEDEQLSVLFQPIVSLDRQAIYGYEGLVRGPEHSLLNRPKFLFAAAAKYGRLRELDALCRKLIVREFARLQLPGCLFLNLSPGALTDPAFLRDPLLDQLRRYGVPPDRVVVEVAERSAADLARLRLPLQRCREWGFQIALEVSAADPSLGPFRTETTPDFLKLDRHCIQGLDQDQTQRQTLTAFLDTATALGCQVIFKGVETRTEYTFLLQLGAKLAQGFHFACPQKVPDTVAKREWFGEPRPRSIFSDQLTAALLVQTIPTVPSDMPVQDVGELFHADEGLPSVAVVRGLEVLGLIPRSEVLNLLASRYGRDLFGRLPVRDFLRKSTLMVDLETPLEEVSRLLTNAVDHHREEFLVTDGGRLVGKGTLLDLLRTITEVQVNRARYANPLTLLPGNVVIQQRLGDFLKAGQPFHVAYCDLDHFKAYNDAYGYLRGDEVIQLLGRLLVQYADPERDFVGHIGGDDFIVLFRSPDWRERCFELLQTFEAVIPDQYSARDRCNGGIYGTDRDGQPRHFPFVALSIGVVPVTAPHPGISPELIAEWAAAAKAKAKEREGNALCVEDPRPGSGPTPGSRLAAGTY